MSCPTLVRCVGVVWTGICYIQVTVRQHIVLAAYVGVGVKMKPVVLYPGGDDDVIGNKTRHLAFQYGGVARNHVLIVHLNRILLIDNC